MLTTVGRTAYHLSAMIPSEFVDEQIVVALNRTLPGFAFEPILKTHSRSGTRSVTVELPVPERAEYQFVLWFQPEKQIHARLLPIGRSSGIAVLMIWAKRFFVALPMAVAAVLTVLIIFADQPQRLAEFAGKVRKISAATTFFL